MLIQIDNTGYYTTHAQKSKLLIIINIMGYIKNMLPTYF